MTSAPNALNSYRALPDPDGHFGNFGGRFVAETLMPLILELEQAYKDAKADPAFQKELDYFLHHYVGRAKTRIIAETGAGQHGVATATVCARFGLPCTVYMGSKDIKRQSSNVFRMRLLGAEVKPVVSGSCSLKDAMNEALRDWVTNVEDTFYIIGTAAVEAAGHGVHTGKHAASLTAGKPGVLHGNRTYLLMDDDGQIKEADSISAGLDYPGIGPEHSWLKDIGRARYVPITDKEALEAFKLCSELEGIIPALECSHAIAQVMKEAPKMGKDKIILMCLSGRGDKDIFTVAEALGVEL